MVEVLALLGLLFIGYALWRDRNQQDKRKAELQEYKKIHEELVKAQKDVKVLIEHMEKTSESIVEDIAHRLEEIKDIEKSLQLIDLRQETGPDYNDRQNKLLSENDELQPPVAKTIDFPSVKEEGTKVSKTAKASPKQNKSVTRHRKHAQKEQTVKEVPAVSEATPKQQMVYAMANLGYSEEEIAKNMSIGKGEVRLILELKRKGEKYNA